MVSCRRSSCQGSRRRGVTPRMRRPQRSGWSARCELSREPSTGPYSRSLPSWGYGEESVQQTDIDDGHAPGVTTTEAKRIKELGQENRELKWVNGI